MRVANSGRSQVFPMKIHAEMAKSYSIYHRIIRQHVRTYSDANRMKSVKWTFKESPFEVLSLPKTATSKDIKSRYYQLCKEIHPDRTISLPEHEREKCESKFIQVQSAYELLSDEHTRRFYADYYSDGMPASSYSAGPAYVDPWNMQRNRPGHGHDEPFVHGQGSTGTDSVKNGLHVVYPWFYGLAFLGGSLWFLESRIADAQKRQKELAWALYLRERQKDGLLGVVGDDEHPLPKKEFK